MKSRDRDTLHTDIILCLIVACGVRIAVTDRHTQTQTKQSFVSPPPPLEFCCTAWWLMPALLNISNGLVCPPPLDKLSGWNPTKYNTLTEHYVMRNICVHTYFFCHWSGSVIIKGLEKPLYRIGQQTSVPGVLEQNITAPSWKAVTWVLFLTDQALNIFSTLFMSYARYMHRCFNFCDNITFLIFGQYYGRSKCVKFKQWGINIQRLIPCVSDNKKTFCIKHLLPYSAYISRV